jgi:hypothetical protein
MQIKAASLGIPSAMGAAGYHAVSLVLFASVMQEVRRCDEARGNRRDLIKMDSSVGCPENVKVSLFSARHLLAASTRRL